MEHKGISGVNVFVPPKLLLAFVFNLLLLIVVDLILLIM